MAFSALLRLFRHFDDLGQVLADGVVILPLVGAQARGAILDTVCQIGKIAAAVFSQGVQRAIAEKAVEIFRIRSFVAREILMNFLPIIL